MFKRLLFSIMQKRVKRSSSAYIKYLQSIGISIGHNCHIDPHTSTIDISRPSLVTIGNNVYMNSYFTLLTHDWVSGVFRNVGLDFLPSSGSVTIGNNVGFGRNVMILKGVTIGDNVFIGANSVVNKDIPSNSIAVGNPCKVVKSLDDYHKIRLNKSLQESFEYARSIKNRFQRAPRASDFKEEFVFFVDGKDIDLYPEIPIKSQLGPLFEDYKNTHKAPFKNLDAFLKAAGVNEDNK